MKRIVDLKNLLLGFLKTLTLAWVAVLTVIMVAGCANINYREPSDESAIDEKVLSENIGKEKDPVQLSHYIVRRAMLKVRAGSQQLNYSGALDDLKKAVKLNPELYRVREINDWIGVLGKLSGMRAEASLLKEKSDLAEYRVRILQEKIEKLEKQNQELHGTIETLQSLELQREQRMQQVR